MVRSKQQTRIALPPQRFRLKDSVYAIEEPTLEIQISLRGERPRLSPLPLATLAPRARRRELILAASERLHGIPHELVRIDG